MNPKTFYLFDSTIIAALIGGFFVIYAAYYTINRQLKKNARQIFHDTVHEILTGLYPDPVNWPRNSWQFLQDCMPQLQTAIGKLRFHLSVAENNRLSDAWKKYREFCQKINDANIMARPNNPTTPSIDQKAVFKRHVDTLLEYDKK